METHPIFELFNWLIPPILACTYLYIFTDEWRFSIQTVNKIFLSSGILFVIVTGGVFWKFGNTQLGKLCLSVFALGMGTPLFLYISQYRDGRAIFSCSSAITFNLVGAVIGEAVGSANTPIRLMIKVGLHVVIFILVCRYFSGPSKRLMREMAHGWHRMALVPISSSILCLLLLLSEEIYHEKSFKLIALSLAFAVICSYITFYHMFCVLQKQFRMQTNYALLDSQMDFLNKQMETVKAGNEQLRIFRHDIRHYIAIQLSCLENGRIDEAKEVLTSMEKNLSEISGKTPGYTDSPLLNGVIANYEDRAKRAGIRFSVRMSMPEDPEIGGLELAVVISNALENACNACLKIPEGVERAIYLTGSQNQKQYFLEVANTYLGEVHFNKEGTSPVTSEEGHGYGTQSIVAFAEKHGAYVDFKAEDKLFKMRIIF